jgi:inner membrane protein
MGKWMQTMTARVLGIGMLALLMLIPLTQVRGLIAERLALREQAAAKIAEGWGGPQVLGGIVLAVPTRRAVVGENGKPGVRESTEIVLADRMQVKASLAVERRRYGMYEVPVYVAETHLGAHFSAEDLRSFEQSSDATWLGGKAELRLLVADTQGLKDVGQLRVNGVSHRFNSSSARTGGLASVTVPIDLAAYAEGPIDIELDLRLAGTESLQVLPLARRADVSLGAPWPDPSFVGALLPAERKVDKAGFQAHWQMLDLNRSFGQHWDAGNAQIDAEVTQSAFGVELYQPANVYQQNERAGKYGLLFIALTFVAFFMFDIMRRMRLHPVQYLLIGAALATFYVLLLALSEQIGFALAYLVAATAVVGIVAGYAAAVLGAWRAGLLLGGVIALVYAVLYGLIGAEQYALLIGACVLLVVVGLLMYLTRRIDWYSPLEPT